MWVLVVECAASDQDLLLADLYARGTTGVIEDDLPGERVELRAFFDEPFDAGEMAAMSPRWEAADDTNWARKVMEDWDPVEVGERFFVAPDWRDDPTPAGRIRLVVSPGSVLGTGYHPTTQMCLEAMEQFLMPADRFFDLGCGSGILSHAAWLLGMRRIVASDVDLHATAQASEQLSAAGVEATVFTGSTRAVRTGSIDLLVANLGPMVLLSLETEITRCLSDGGRAVLSGFRPARLDTITQAYEAAGYQHLSAAHRNNWTCAVVRKPAHSP